MRGAVWVLAIAAIGGGAVGLFVHARRSTIDRQLDTEMSAALARGGIADLGRAQAVGRRLVVGGGGGRAEAAALAFVDARLAVDYGLPLAAEAQEVLAHAGLPDRRADDAAAMAASAKALLAARNGDREGAARIAAAAADAHPAMPQPLYALGRVRALGGDLAAAARAFEAAIIVAPGFVASRLARAEVLLDLGEAAAARATLAPAMAEAPDDPRAELLLEEIEAATGARAPGAPPICTGERWRPPPISAACLLARAAAERRAGRRSAARTDAEAAAAVVPDEPRLLARTALVLAQLGAVDRAATLVVRGRRLAAPELPALSWASAAVVLGRGRAGALPAGPRPADPETDLLVARTALAAGGVGALGAALRALGPRAVAGDADLARFERLGTRGRRRGPPGADDDPLQAYLDGLAAQLDGDLPRATDRFAHALAGHGDACRAAGEYVAALRAQKRRPDPALFARLRAESSRCADLR